MLKHWIFTALLIPGFASAACTIVFTSSGERYDTLHSGTVVLTHNSNVVLKNAVLMKTAVRETLAVSTPAGFNAYLQSTFHDSGHVFFGRMDSVIEKGFEGGDTLVSGLSISMTLNPRDTSQAGRANPFYARFQIDTLLRGSLPSKTFWVKGYKNNGCTHPYGAYKNQRFLNISSGFTSMTDLKLPIASSYLSGGYIVPDAHWLTFPYLVSPKFPGLRVDIREMLPAYTVGVQRKIFLRGSEKSEAAYLPNGRPLPGDVGDRKTVLPALKKL